MEREQAKGLVERLLDLSDWLERTELPGSDPEFRGKYEAFHRVKEGVIQAMMGIF